MKGFTTRTKGARTCGSHCFEKSLLSVGRNARDAKNDTRRQDAATRRSGVLRGSPHATRRFVFGHTLSAREVGSPPFVSSRASFCVSSYEHERETD